MSLAPDTRIGTYEILAKLSEGGVDGDGSPDLAVGGGTGLHYGDGRLAVSLAYSLDRYDFPAAGGARRLEQYSSLTARIGWRVR